MRSDGTGRERLTGGPDLDYAAMWSRDRRKIAFLRSEDESEHPNLMVMSAHGSGVERIGGPVSDFFDWSPDGDEIAYTKVVSGDEPLQAHRTAIVVVDVTTGEERELAGSGNRPAWSPDGSRVLYEDERCDDELLNRGCNVDIYMVHVRSGEITRLTHARGRDYGANWSPDGRRIAFTTTRHATYSDGVPLTSEVYVMDLDGRGQTRLTHDSKAHDEEVTWSPDGRWIAYRHRFDDDVADRDGEVFVVQPNGSRRRRLTDNDRGEYDPSWSPDGGQLVFTGCSAHCKDAEAFVVDIHGGDERRLTDNRREEWRMFWWSV